LLGNIDWRGVRLPLISFEALNGAQQAATDRRSRIAILNGIGGDEELPFFGVVTQGIPRLMVLDNTAISVVSQPDNDYPLALQQTLVQDQEAIIPDQEKLEDMIRQQGIKVTA
jgi:chemosensory pili system protein ChpC